MKKRMLVISAIIIIAISVSFFETRNPITAYCIGLTVQKENNEIIYGFIIAKLEEEGASIEVTLIKQNGKFSYALQSLKESDILLFYPTVKGIYICRDINKTEIDDMLNTIFEMHSFPTDITVVMTNDPNKLILEKDIGSGISGALFIPKLIENQKRKVTLIDYAKGKEIPLICYQNGQFNIQKQTD
ncbi:MAG: hypothetical protein A2Y17_02900 [Clostridiales bacterium GWF2_38_85]|nr:MAG: hypothetical protein A2Y17_02900 [Clostridiales bacterium GWF2_38_85]